MLGGNPASPPVTSLLYAGEMFDTNSQMYYLRARYYDTLTGRFNRMDPFAGNNRDPQSLHKYLYANCNPVNGVDPTGEMGFFSLSFSITNVLIGLAIALPIVAIISGWPLYVYRFTGDAYLTFTKKTPGTNNETTYTIRIREAPEFESEIKKVEQSGDKITFFEYVGHGFGDDGPNRDQRGWGLSIGEGGFVTKRRPEYDDTGLIYFNDLRTSIINVFASDALIELEACYSAFGSDSIAHRFKKSLPSVSVWGYTGWAMPVPVIGVHGGFSFGGWTEVK